MNPDQVELEAKVSDLKRELERVRGPYYRRVDGYDEDAATIRSDWEGAAVFRIVVELNRVWLALEALKRLALKALPRAPKPDTRPMHPEAPALQFGPVPTGWNEKHDYIRAVFKADLRLVSREELHRLATVLDDLGFEGFRIWKDAEDRAYNARLVWHRVRAELRARPFEVIEGGGESRPSRAPLRLVDES